MAEETAGAGPRATLFLSYARDDRARAEKLITALERHGYELWWDAKLEGGSTFADSISDALHKADAVLVLWSKNSVSSDWVRDEASVGRDRKRLVPLSLDGVEQPLGFRQYHSIDLSHWKGRSDCPETRAVDRAVNIILRGKPMPDQPLATGPSRRAILAAGGGAGLLALGGGALLWNQGWFRGGGDVDNSIAVLPFKNLGGDPTQTYLADGITEEIRSTLKRIPALRVLGSTSSALAAEGGGGAKAIAERLGVAFLLEGSVQRAGEMLRIGADLTEGRSGFSSWSNQIDRPMTDIFAVQREIAQTVAGALEAQIATARPEVGGTSNVQAYEYYLRGRQKYFTSTSEGEDRESLALLDLAVSTDPKFAKAQALRARCLYYLGSSLTSPSEAKTFSDRSIQVAQHAVRLAPGLADAHLAVGLARFGRLDLKGSLPPIRKALELAPNDADVLRNYSIVIGNLGDTDSARDTATRALSLDPLNPLMHLRLGDAEYLAHQYTPAIGRFEKALSLNPKAQTANGSLAYCHMLLGQPDAAVKYADKETIPWMRLTALAIVRRKMGDAAAVRDFEELKKEGDRVAYQQAEVLSQWGDKEAAIKTLEIAATTRDPGIVGARMDPLLIPLRGDPRYVAVLKQVGLI